MPDIFISYRRDDSAANARLLYQRLRTELPGSTVFMDVEEIALGAQWQNELTRHIVDADVVLVVIGRAWLHGREGEERRLDDPGDFVRWEIAEALRLDKRVIPVLVDGATMPSADELPQAIAALPGRQAQVVSHLNFDDDVATLLARLGGGRHASDVIARLQHIVRLSRATVVIAIGVGSAALAFAWANIFDLLGLDTRTASFTMLIGDVLAEPAIAAELLLVGIQPDDTETIRLRPERRAEYAALIERAAEQGARGIVFDLSLTRDSALDNRLAEAVSMAVRSGTRVVFGFNTLTADGADAIAVLHTSGAALGLTCVGDRLGNVTYATLAMQTTDALVGSLPLHAAFDVARIGGFAEEGRQLQLLDRQERLQMVRYSLLESIDRPDADCPARLPGAVVARLIVRLSHKERWRSPERRVPFDQLLHDPPVSGRLDDKVVLVGAQHPSDLLKTRLDGTPSRYGFEFHADAINALLTDAVVRPIGFAAQWLMSLAAIALATTWRLLRLGKSRRIDMLVLPLLCLLLIAVAVVLYARHGLLVDSLYHVAALLLTWWLLGHLERRWTDVQA